VAISARESSDLIMVNMPVGQRAGDVYQERRRHLSPSSATSIRAEIDRLVGLFGVDRLSSRPSRPDRGVGPRQRPVLE